MLVRPLRLADEHAIGHWLRQAHLNGLRDPRWMLDPLAARGATTLRVCSLCLQTPNAYWRSGWLEIDRPWCSVHQVWLIDRCPACYRTLRWGRTRLLECECGQDLRELEVSELGAQVFEALGAVPVPVLLWLGAIARFGLLGKPLKGASNQEVAEMASLIQLGAAQTVDWPAAFFVTLDSRRVGAAQQTSDRLELLTTALPGLTKRLGKIRDRSWRAKVANAVGDYVGSSRPGHAPLVWKSAPGCRPPSVVEVARSLGIGAARLAGALDGLAHGGVSIRRTAGGRFRRLVSADAAKAAKTVLDSQVAPKPAARMLGVSVSRLKQLISEGVFDLSHGMLDRLAVTALRNDLLALANERHEASDGMALEDAMRYWVPMSRTGAFLDALLSKEISCYSSHADEQSVVLTLNPSAVFSWSASELAANRSWMTIPEAATALGLKQQVVYHLVRVGLIDACVHKLKNRNAQVVTHQAILSFKRNFVPLAWAAVRAGVDHRQGLHWALTNHLELASGPTVDGGRQYLLRVAPGDCSRWMDELWGAVEREPDGKLAGASVGWQAIQST